MRKPKASKIYTPIFSFFRERVANIMISDLRPVLNKSPGNFTFYRGITVVKKVINRKTKKVNVTN